MNSDYLFQSRASKCIFILPKAFSNAMRFARISVLALGLCRRNAASFALRIVGNDVYRVETPVPAWNVDGSAEHKPKKHSSWIKCHK